jgi:CheY-like chemotaxis protein
VGDPPTVKLKCFQYSLAGTVNNQFTVLLAEDDPNDRRLFQLALRRNQKPIQVHEVADGMEVIQYLKGEGKFEDRAKFPLPNLLILDLKMPRMTGLEVLHWLRHRPEFARLCTVMLSGSGLDKDVAEAYQLGVNSYFRKPNDFNHFIKVLNAIFEYWLLTERCDGRADPSRPTVGFHPITEEKNTPDTPCRQ